MVASVSLYSATFLLVSRLKEIQRRERDSDAYMKQVQRETPCRNGDTLAALEDAEETCATRIVELKADLQQEEERIRPLRQALASEQSNLANIHTRKNIWHGEHGSKLRASPSIS